MAYQAAWLRCLGITQILLGCLLIMFSVPIGLLLNFWLREMFAILSGALIFFLGLVDYLVAKSAEMTRKKMVKGLISSFLCCFMTWIPIIGYSVSLSTGCLPDQNSDCFHYDVTPESAEGVVLGLFNVNLFLGVTAFLTTLFRHIVWWIALCCLSSAENQPRVGRRCEEAREMSQRGPQPSANSLQTFDLPTFNSYLATSSGLLTPYYTAENQETPPPCYSTLNQDTTLPDSSVGKRDAPPPYSASDTSPLDTPPSYSVVFDRVRRSQDTQL